MKKKIAITIDEEVLNAIKKIARDEDRTLSSQINKILKDKIKNSHVNSSVVCLPQTTISV